MDCQRGYVGVFHELGGPEKERKEVVIIKTPYTMRACRFQVVRGLDVTHEMHVSNVHSKYDHLEVCG